MNRTFSFLLLLLFLSPAWLWGQQSGIKSNLLYDATGTLNFGVEVGLSPRWSLDLSGNYRPWSFSDTRTLRHALLQPEVRYWLCQRFNGHFFGAHLIGSVFNAGGFNFPGKRFEELKTSHYEGWAAGAGLSYGYQWMIGERWNLEASFGLGYVHAWYDRYECHHCGRKLEAGRSSGFFTPTKVAVSIIYFIR